MLGVGAITRVKSTKIGLQETEQKQQDVDWYR